MPKVGGLLIGRAIRLAVVFCALLTAAAPARAAPPAHLALVIGETNYAALPPLPACTGSARAVAAALRHIGFQVIEKLDTTNGETGAALTDFAKQVQDAPGSAAVVYFCGYAVGLNGRGFLLPVSATIERPFDVLTQGLVAGSLLDATGGAGTAAGLLLLDVFAQPGNTPSPGLDRLAQGRPAATQGYLAIGENSPGDSRTPMAVALSGALSAATVETGAVLADLQRRLATTAGLAVAGVQIPSLPGFLAGGPAPHPTPPPEKQATQAPAPPEPAPPPRVPAASAPPAAPAAPAPRAAPPVMPEESQMTEPDRRRVQAALAVLGYYDGRVDGQFGPETRAAIRRFQHEIGAEMTGRLTAEQAGRLVAGRS